MAELSETKPHALIVPMPFQGHLAPAVNLTIKLAANNFTVTFVNSEASHHNIADIFNTAPVDIRYELVANELQPDSLHRNYNDHEQMFYSLYVTMRTKVEELVKKLSNERTPVTCLVADVFFGWPCDVAEMFRLPFVALWTQPALALAQYYHAELLVKNGHFRCQKNRKDSISYLPGISSIEPTELISHLQEPDTSSLLHQTVFKVSENLKKSTFVLCNTVQELEPEVITALRQNRLQHLYPVGPISRLDKPILNTSLWPHSDCTKWLDSKAPRSVLYVSFGSISQLRERDMLEIAYGMLASKVNFVWILRYGESAQTFPDEFFELSKHKGIFVPWCNQREVLRHCAVGGFLTHCGWNSILESVWCGVPMLCFPLFSDQFSNRKLVVKEWKIGVDIGNSNEVSRDEVCERVDGLFFGNEGECIKKGIEEIKRMVEDATGADGSSEKNFSQFIADLVKHRS